MEPERYDLKVVLFHVGEKGKTSHKAINLQSFIDTLNKPVIRQRLKDGLLFGLFTHDDRKLARDSNIPHHDMVMKDDDLCNITKAVTVKDGVVYAYLNLVKDAPAAKRFMTLWKMGSKIGVSMSTELIERDEFYIQELLGVDITCRPEFDSPIVEANFSEGKGRPDINYKDSITLGASIDPSEKVLAGDFSEIEPAEVSTAPVSKPMTDFSESKPKDFSVRDYLRERQRQPALVLKQRIQEVIRYLRFATPKSVANYATFLRRYILEYINEWVMMSISNPSNDLNLALGLRLSEYCEERSPMRSLQMALKRARTQMTQTGTMTKDVQTQLNQTFSDVMRQIYEYINDKVGDDNKKI